MTKIFKLSMLLPALWSCADVCQAVAVVSPVGPAAFTLGKTDASAPSGGLRIEWASEVDLEDTAASLSWQRVELDMPLGDFYPLTGSDSLGFGLRYQGTWLDSTVADMDLHDVRLAVTWLHRSPGSKWGFIGEVAPGVASDFSSVSSDDFSLNWFLGARYEVSNSFAWLLGVGSDVATGDTDIVPTLGFQWKPCDEVYVSLSGTTFMATWQASNDWLLRAGVWPSGGVWNVDVAGTSLDAKLTSYRAGVGVERRIKDSMWVSLWAGATVANEIEIDTAAGNKLFNDDADSGWFVNLGLRVAAW